MTVETKPGVKKPDDEPELSKWVGPVQRKKGSGIRSWLVLDSSGQARVMEAGKHSIMRRMGLPGRDLRILDPMLSYPSTVLGRERAIVVNLEHIKAMVTAHEVLLLNSRDPYVSHFAEDLQWRVLRLHQATQNQEEAKGTTNDTEWTTIYDPDENKDTDAIPRKMSIDFPPGYQPISDEDNVTDEKQDLKNKDGVKTLPFEFIALEACLEATCSSLDKEARTLEQEAHLALDKLTSKISSLNLERVRQIKSRLVALTGRVQKVRDELEHLLDDDDDMAEMYLTEKLSQPDLENSSIVSMNEHDDANEHDDVNEEAQPETDDRSEVEAGDSKDRNLRRNSTLAVSRTHMSRMSSPTHTTSSKQVDVEELEMLLEAYFAQIDGTLNKLTTLREYVDDTEDYINIMLDDKQNHLLRVGVMLSTASLVLSAFITVTGILGMNITIKLFDPAKYGDREFLWTVGGGASSTVIFYVIAIIWCKNKRLLE